MAEFEHVLGMSDLRARLRQLTPRVLKRVAIPATGAASAVVRDKAIDRAPEWHGDVSRGHPPPGTLKSSIYSVPVKSKWRSDYVVFFVRVRAGDKTVKVGRATTQRAWDPTTGKRVKGVRYRFQETKAVVGAYYWWHVEFGTVNMAGRHFMRDAAREGAFGAAAVYVEVARARMPVVVDDLRGVKG